jgi:hypothetical protein
LTHATGKASAIGKLRSLIYQQNHRERANKQKTDHQKEKKTQNKKNKANKQTIKQTKRAASLTVHSESHNLGQ